MSKYTTSEGVDNRGFSNVLDGGYTVYKGGSSFRNRSNGGLEAQYRDARLGEQTFPNSKYPPQQTERKSHAAIEGGDSPLTKDQEASLDESQKGIMHLLSVYADKCSLNGVIFIKSSKYRVVKVIWSFLLLASLAFMVVHLYQLASTYYSYEKQSKVDLKFENLNFPAVTFCNVNAMKLSQSHMASEELKNLMNQVNPMEMTNFVDDWEPSYMEETYQFDKNGEPVNTWGSGSFGDDDDDYYDSFYGTTETEAPDDAPNTGLKRRKRSMDGYSEFSSNFTWQSRTNSFFDDYNFTGLSDVMYDNYMQQTFQGSWEAESQPSRFEQIAGQFIALYNQENGTIRQQMGHRIQDMLIQCSFVGRKCVQSNFTMVASSTMGNCYTIQYNKFVARKSGPREGLTLMLNLENHEYIPGITNAKGAKLVVHEPGTIPFPDDEGMAIGAGMETSIGLRWNSISRLGSPYGDCTDVDTFRLRHGIKYTRQACQEICEMEEISKHCKCYNAVKPFMYTLLRNRDDLKPCQREQSMVWCMESVKWSFQSNSSCPCSSPCKEVAYKKTISSKPWPSPEFAKLVAKTVCKEKPGNHLCDADFMDENRLKEHFVKVNIYFETLNYESVSEEPNYSEFQFVSDIGGTVGLYVGISALSAFEIVHLVISILRYLFTRRTKA